VVLFPLAPRSAGIGLPAGVLGQAIAAAGDRRIDVPTVPTERLWYNAAPIAATCNGSPRKSSRMMCSCVIRIFTATYLKSGIMRCASFSDGLALCQRSTGYRRCGMRPRWRGEPHAQGSVDTKSTAGAFCRPQRPVSFACTRVRLTQGLFSLRTECAFNGAQLIQDDRLEHTPTVLREGHS